MGFAGYDLSFFKLTPEISVGDGEISRVFCLFSEDLVGERMLKRMFLSRGD